MGNKAREPTHGTMRKRIDEILEEVKTAQAQKVHVKEIQGRIAPHLEKEPSLTVPLIEALATVASPQTAQLLLDMLQRAERKDVIRAIKRSLYRLKQRGVRWKEELAEAAPVLRPPEPGEPKGYLGPPDAAGSRVVVVVRPRAQGGVRAFLGIVNDLEGIQRFEPNDLRTKGVNPFIDALSSEAFPVVEAPVGYCVQVLKETAELTKRLGKAVPLSYQDAKTGWKEIVWNGSVPIIYHHIPEDTLRDQEGRLRESRSLHGVPPFSSWFLNPEPVRKHVEAVKEAEQSRLALTPQQRDARLHDVYVTALQELFPDDARLLWKRRLEETAYVLLQTGREKDAMTALSAAVDLQKPLNTLNPNPFVWALLLKSIYALIEPQRVETRQETGDSRIITP